MDIEFRVDSYESLVLWSYYLISCSRLHVEFCVDVEFSAEACCRGVLREL